MMQTIDLRGIQPNRAAFTSLVPRPAVDVSVALHVATELIDDVRSRGRAALDEQAEKFDGGRAKAIRVPSSEIAVAIRALAGDVRDGLEEAIVRVRQATAAQVPAAGLTTIGPGAPIVQRGRP